MTLDTQCPCGSELSFETCCGPYLSGDKIPATAELLMRSRYTAYTRMDDKYLLSTWHPDTRPDTKTPSDEGDGGVWTGLTILRTEAGQPGDNDGIVEFIARYKINGTASQLHEISEFKHDGKQWLYVDAISPQPVRRDAPKVGRNDPCPCGSGKKYKKCCGAN